MFLALAMAPFPAAAYWLESFEDAWMSPSGGGAELGALEVSYLSASKLQVKMHVDDMDLKATTTNTSMMIESNTHNRFVIGAERKLVHGHTIAEVHLTDKTFLTLQSKNGRNVMMEVDGSEYSEQQLANMYEESPAVQAGVKHAHAAYQAAMSELFTVTTTACKRLFTGLRSSHRWRCVPDPQQASGRLRRHGVARRNRARRHRNRVPAHATVFDVGHGSLEGD